MRLHTSAPSLSWHTSGGPRVCPEAVWINACLRDAPPKGRLRHGLRSRTVVLVTHNPDDIGAGDSRLDLDEAAATSSLAVLAGAS
jgi:hypothetical protein